VVKIRKENQQNDTRTEMENKNGRSNMEDEKFSCKETEIISTVYTKQEEFCKKFGSFAAP
jgi:hypothetical protein